MSCPPFTLLDLQTLFLDGLEFGVLLLNFAQRLRHKNADVPDIKFISIGAAGVCRTLNLGQSAKAKESRSWVLFEI